MYKQNAKKILKKELSKYGLEFQDDSDEDVPRLSIVKPEQKFVKMLFGIPQKSKEVARIIGSSLEGKIEVLVFEKEAADTIKEVLERVKRETGKQYSISKGY